MNNNRVPCNISVVGNTYWESCEANGFCGQVAGWQGNSNNGNWVVQHGDSGAVVFTIHSSNTRNALGMASGQCCGGNPADTVYFVGQAQVLGELHVHLNPHT